jgi:hypothetical protein
MTLRKIKKNKGFALLFAVTISSILLSVALGVADIAVNEIKFGTSARDTNDAFFAADTAIECALFNDKPAPGPNSFPVAGPATPITCASNPPITPVFTPPNPALYTFTVNTLGSSGLSCAKVTISKDTVVRAPSILTTIISDGYNTGDASCNSTTTNRVQRELKVSY